MHLYEVLTIASIVVVSAVVPKNDYAVKRALVLMRPKNILHHTDIDLHRPKSVKRVPGDLQHSHENPYKYNEGHSEPYYFCPKEEDTKLLFGKIHSEEHESPYFCESPLRTRFIHLTSDATFHLPITEELYFHGYRYCYPKDKTEILFRNESVYNFLYQLNDKGRILYVKYTIYSRDLLDSDEIPAEEKDFITEPTSLVEEHVREYEKLKEGLEDMEEKMKDFPLEGSGQTLGENQDYYRATLASRFHFPFVQYKRPLFHYSNITLVHKDILNLFVETQKFISTIEVDQLRIFAVPYFHLPKKHTPNEYTYRDYVPDIIGYLLFDDEEKKGIAIILHNESESDKKKIQPLCENNDDKMTCKSYHKHLNEKQVNEKILTSAYCCKINHILKKWEFPTPFEITKQEFKDLDI